MSVRETALAWRLAILATAFGAAFAATAAAQLDTPAPARPAQTVGEPDSNVLQSGMAFDDLDPDAPVPATRVWADRLATLSPANPRAYFVLGEEVAGAARSRSDTELARHLYALAFELDRRRQEAGASADPGLAASACLALADLARSEEDRRWLIALARSVDRRYASPDWSRAAQPAWSGRAGFLAAEFLGLVRSGDGAQARNRLDDEEVARVLEEHEGMIGGVGSSGFLAEIVRQSRQWPCPQCGNERITTLGETRPPRRGLCPTCHGNPGPLLTDQALINQLRFESGLLDGIQSSWSAQMALDLGAPLREPRAEELAPTLGVDADLPYFRDGRWVEAPTRGTAPPLPSPSPANPRDRNDLSRPTAEPATRPTVPQAAP
ncbi:MAG: hypothetical protein KDA05_09070 [Phycisphaerales bacterium]|nr:hypothetical protein [Phycisphaerales bacterium]MCB9840024.1 hypothetical protein [Phycisphaeraceae bacterium]